MVETIVGKRGRGKTSLVAEILVRQQWDQIFIFDYCAEFGDFAIPGYCYVQTQGFVDFCEGVWENSREGIETLLVLDEVAMYGKFNYLVEHILRLGRHKQIQVVTTAQRPAILPMIVRSQTDQWYFFAVSEPADVEYLSKVVQPETLQAIVNLDKFQYIRVGL